MRGGHRRLAIALLAGLVAGCVTSDDTPVHDDSLQECFDIEAGGEARTVHDAILDHVVGPDLDDPIYGLAHGATSTEITAACLDYSVMR